jgi:hypothetical protein
MASSVGEITAPYAASTNVSGITPSSGWSPIPTGLILNLQTYIGQFNFQASFANLPKHNHFFPADDNVMVNFPHSAPYFAGVGKYTAGGPYQYDAYSENSGSAFPHTTSYAIVNTVITSNGKVVSFSYGDEFNDPEDLYFTQPTYITLFLMKLV